MAMNPGYSGEQQYGMQPVTEQPANQPTLHARELAKMEKEKGIQIMPQPQANPGCPPGLEYLTQLDQLIIKQQVELLEALTGWEQRNKYRIMNNIGQQAFFAKEESTCFQRQCCANGREFTMRISDNLNREVIVVERPFKCCAGCCWCADSAGCSMELTVKDGQGQLLGHVKQRSSKFKPHYMIYDANMTEIGRIRGPCCQCSCPCCGDIAFPVTDPKETTKIGEITKQWSGVVKEYFTDADTFSVTFPGDLDVRIKAVFIGAAFLVDFMHFERGGDN